MHNFAKCLEILCEKPPRDRLLLISYSTSYATVATTATCSCISGYSIEGLAVLTCGKNGHWSGKFPTCVGMSLQNCFVY